MESRWHYFLVFVLFVLGPVAQGDLTDDPDELDKKEKPKPKVVVEPVLEKDSVCFVMVLLFSSNENLNVFV